MAYKVTETDSAERDIGEILEYMVNKLFNPSAAAAFADEIDDKYVKLADNPYMYEESRDPRLKKQGYRRVSINNYVMLYLVDDSKKEVIIARIFYGKQEYTKLI
ncbi:plasmid stabilization protein [Clostridia bacterium]|nr:plasmid stabilization protein [Clostridia bacterium]